MKELLEGIQKVSMSISNVEKNMTVGEGRSAYKAVSEADVLSAVRKAEKDAGIISIPVSQNIEKSEVVNLVRRDGSTVVNFSEIVKMTVRIYLIADPKQFIEIEAYGHGLDSGDKGTGKASTYARKYCLMNAYKIITGEDPDKDKSEDMSPQKSDFDIAVDEVNKAQTIDSLQDTWNNWSCFHGDSAFKVAVNKRKAQLQPKEK